MLVVLLSVVCGWRVMFQLSGFYCRDLEPPQGESAHTNKGCYGLVRLVGPIGESRDLIQASLRKRLFGSIGLRNLMAGSFQGACQPKQKPLASRQ